MLKGGDPKKTWPDLWSHQWFPGALVSASRGLRLPGQPLGVCPSGSLLVVRLRQPATFLHLWVGWLDARWKCWTRILGFVERTRKIKKYQKHWESHDLAGTRSQKRYSTFHDKRCSPFSDNPRMTDWIDGATTVIRGFKNDRLCTGDCHRQFSTHSNFGMFQNFTRF